MKYNLSIKISIFFRLYISFYDIYDIVNNNYVNIILFF